MQRVQADFALMRLHFLSARARLHLVRAFLLFMLAHVMRWVVFFGWVVLFGWVVVFGSGSAAIWSPVPPPRGPGFTGAGLQSGSLPPGMTTRPELAPGHPYSTLGSGITSMPSLCAKAIAFPSSDQLGLSSVGSSPVLQA